MIVDAREHREFVDGLARGLSVIEAFDADSPELTLSEVARRTGHSAAGAMSARSTVVSR